MSKVQRIISKTKLLTIDPIVIVRKIINNLASATRFLLINGSKLTLNISRQVIAIKNICETIPITLIVPIEIIYILLIYEYKKSSLRIFSYELFKLLFILDRKSVV